MPIFGEVKADTDITTCPVGYTEITSSCYKKFSELRTWYEAKASCETESATLAMPRSGTDQLKQSLELQEDNRYWVGGSQDIGTNFWTWLDGTAVADAQWFTNQPSLKSEGCIFLKRTSNAIALGDRKCDKQHEFICEYVPTSTWGTPTASTTTTTESADDGPAGLAAVLAHLAAAMEENTKLLQSLNHKKPPLSNATVLEKLKTQPGVSDTDSESVLFLSVVQDPPLAMGIFSLNESYQQAVKLRWLLSIQCLVVGGGLMVSSGDVDLDAVWAQTGPGAGGGEVTVTVKVHSVTAIDSLARTAGLHIGLELGWQDNRLVYNIRQPELGEKFEFSPQILR